MTKLYYKKLSQWYDPELVFTTLFAQKKYSFWLDSSLVNKENRFSYMGSSPDEIYSYSLKDSKTKIYKDTTSTYATQDIFTFLDTQIKKKKIQVNNLPFDFTGGYVGYFGYELKALTGGSKIYTSLYPDSLWFLVKKFISFDHLEKKVYLVYLAENKNEADEWFKYIISELKTINTVEPHSGKPDNKITFNPSRTKQQYLKNIRTSKKFLEKGESYQICFTNTFTAESDIRPWDIYKILRKQNPAPYSSFLRYDDLTILCSSPEQFLKIQNHNVQTKPIKGTIRRGDTLAEDKKLKTQLTESKKDWSENAMIVDLLRNDLGKVCEFGSIKVTKSMDIESYQTVHQLVSTIAGKLKNDVSIIDCIKACFPGGSMTGAPKIRTMQILDELEKQARGIYSGALGYISFNQTVALNIVIRTLVAHKSTLSMGAGGAILIDSNPQKEYDEMLLKTKALIESINKAVYTTPMHTVFLALGSNVGDKKKNIKNALEHLGKQVKEIKTAKLYETEPMYHKDQDTFINTVVKGQTLLTPLELLAFVKHAERELGRLERFRNGPREIDIDILFYNQQVFESNELMIPHPRLAERAFVLKPFTDLDPEFIHPVLQKKIKDLYKDLIKKSHNS